MGQRIDTSPGNEVPGPGTYNQDESMIRHHSPSFKIDSQSQRTQMVSKEQMKLPGPGIYNDGRQFGQDAQSFSIRGKGNDNIKSDVPGPGTYNQDETMIRHHSPSFRIDGNT